MASCARNICAKNYQNLIIGFQVTVTNDRDAFLGHSVCSQNASKFENSGSLFNREFFMVEK